MKAKEIIKSYYLQIRCSCLIKHINKLHKEISYGNVSEEFPVVKYDSIRFHGFWNSPHDEKIYSLIRNTLPETMQGKYYRIVKDIITRYLYPHMYPNLRPKCSIYFMSGFHGQHKDSIVDIKDIKLQTKMLDVFSFEPDDVVIDGGSYIGFGALRICKMVPDGKIVAVEAEKKCFNLLNKNIEENDIKNVIPVNKAICESDEPVTIMTRSHQENTLIEGVLYKTEDRRIEGVSIDTLFETLNLKKVDLISLTLNGAEVEAIDGMVKTMRRFRPRIRLAGWYSRNGKEVYQLCREKLKAYDYKVIIGKRGCLYAF